MKTFIKWAIYLSILQLVFTVCGPHWLVGGLLCSVASKTLMPSDSVPDSSLPERLSSPTEPT